MTAAVQLRIRLSNRLARHFDRRPVRMANDRPLVSFTFDDVPVSALTHGAPLLQEAGARGTFYIAGGLLGSRTAHWTVIDGDGVAALHAGGHEIGCHTFSHAPMRDLSGDALQAEVERNRRCLQAIEPGLPIETFAFPFGFASPNAKRRLRPLFTASRGITPSVNAGFADLGLLRAMPLIDGQVSFGTIDRALDATVAQRGWLIFYTHDVAARPSPYGCTPALLAHALRGAAARGIATAGMAEAVRLLGVPRPTRDTATAAAQPAAA
jgi:peptidoglycan/xylan/chitin deacetylase (PgdA/CDA1 family)